MKRDLLQHIILLFLLGMFSNISAQEALPYSESFESGLGNWVNVVGDDFDLTRNTGSTPSGRTGPSGAQNGTYYLFAEASGATSSKRHVFIISAP